MSGPTVALFATCVNDTMFPGTPKAVVTLLERLGCTVEFPLSQSCCGQMFTNTGYFDEAMGSVRNYVTSFAGYDYIGGPSGSGVGSVRDQHPMLAARDGSPALRSGVADVVAKTYELSEFIVDVLGVTLTLPGAGMGVVGAAIGTASAELVAASITMYILCFRSKELSLRIDRGRFLPTWQVVKLSLINI